MSTALNTKKEIIVATVLLLITAVFSLLNFSSISVKPNIFLVVIIVASLLIETWYVYFGFILAELIWLKFTPFFLPEYGILFIISLIVFALVHIFIFSKTRIIRIFLLVLFQMIFWLLLQAGQNILSLVFFLELIYNVIAVELLYAFASWLKKTLF